jgi:hypothetical protein
MGDLGDTIPGQSQAFTRYIYKIQLVRYFIDDCAGVGVIVTALRKMERKERLTGRWNWAKKFRPTFLLFHSD